MFLSKGYLRLTNSVSNVFCGNVIPQRLSSAVAATAESFTEKQPVPDKLYSKIEVELRANELAVLGSYTQFIMTAAQHLEVCVGKNYAPSKPVNERLTLLKSVHIFKKHRVQYETRTYFRHLDFLRLTGSTADTLLEYLQRNLPEGIAMKVTKVEVQRLPESINPPSV